MIEIILGLPHLSAGAILDRARLLQQPVLISANALSRWTRKAGWAQWRGWKTAQLDNASGLPSVDLDSGGFVCAARYGGIPWSVDQYMALAAAYPFRRFASLDYCVEPEIARDREEILDRFHSAHPAQDAIVGGVVAAGKRALHQIGIIGPECAPRPDQIADRLMEQREILRADRDALAMDEAPGIVADHPLQRMGEGVAEIEEGAGAGLALVGGHDRRLRLAG